MPAAWTQRLRTLADRCEALHPDTAADLRRWAESVEQKHPAPIVEPLNLSDLAFSEEPGEGEPLVGRDNAELCGPPVDESLIRREPI